MTKFLKPTIKKIVIFLVLLLDFYLLYSLQSEGTPFGILPAFIQNSPATICPPGFGNVCINNGPPTYNEFLYAFGNYFITYSLLYIMACSIDFITIRKTKKSA